jgi:hypothetical protein
MLYRLRKGAAVFLMGGSAVALLALFVWGRPALDTSGLLVVAAALVVGTVALARGAWWGRIVPIAWSTSVAVLSVVALTRNLYGFGGLLAGAILLRACLAGKAMFARHEGQAPPELDWTRPGMRLVRAAVTANLGAFLGGVTYAMAMFYEPPPVPCCFGPCHHHHFPTVPFCVCLAMSASMLVGVVLLARQRTAGLLLAAVSALAVPVVLISSRHVLGEWALIFGPGIVCGWLVLGRFLPAMARFLRGSPG